MVPGDAARRRPIDAGRACQGEQKRRWKGRGRNGMRGAPAGTLDDKKSKTRFACKSEVFPNCTSVQPENRDDTCGQEGAER